MTAVAAALEKRSRSREADVTQLLYERHARRLFGFCLNRLGTREEAEDAVQTTFLHAQRGLGRGVVPRHEIAWLYAIALNVCRTRIDYARRHPETASDLDALQDVLPATDRTEPDVLVGLPDALERMPRAQREALLLREWRGLSYREIAAELGTSESSVETLLFRARRSLAANLEQPERRGRLSGLNVGSVVAFVKSLLTGGGAVKLAVATAVVAGTVAAVDSTSNGRAHFVRSHVQSPTKPSAASVARPATERRGALSMNLPTAPLRRRQSPPVLPSGVATGERPGADPVAPSAERPVDVKSQGRADGTTDAPLVATADPVASVEASVPTTPVTLPTATVPTLSAAPTISTTAVSVPQVALPTVDVPKLP